MAYTAHPLADAVHGAPPVGRLHTAELVSGGPYQPRFTRFDNPLAAATFPADALPFAGHWGARPPLERVAQPSRQTAYEAAYQAVVLTTDRRDRLDAAITAMAANSSYTAVTRRLRFLRGISTLTGFALAVEFGDWHRFTGSTIGSFVGLAPSENSSGQSRSQGSITKTGNTHARRLLVETAWHHAKPYAHPANDAGPLGAGPGPGPAPRLATTGNQRLHQRLALLHRPEEEAGHRQRRRGPRAGRLGLVISGARLAPH